MDLKEADELWWGQKPINGVRFRYNDCVQVTSGEHEGKDGFVISLISLAPVVYLIELESGGDVRITESQLESANR
jgi:hypothetical protein